MIGWGHKCGPAVIAAGDQQSRRDIGPVLTPEEVTSRSKIDHKLIPARSPRSSSMRDARGDPVCADNALVAINRQQHACTPSRRRCDCDDPLSKELLTKISLFYRVR